MKVLVTGGAGFVGSHCVDLLLNKGHDVTVVDDFSTGRNDNLKDAFLISQKNGRRFRIVRASLAEPATWEALESHDAVLHLAGQTSDRQSITDPDKDFVANVVAAQHLCRWLRKGGTRSLVYANAATSIYGKATSFPTDERNLIKPSTPHGATKAFFELYFSSLVSSSKSAGQWSQDPKSPQYFGWASLRLTEVYGPRQFGGNDGGLLTKSVDAMSKGEAPVISGDGSRTRDYVHVHDAAEAFVLALEKLVETPLDEIFNVGTGVETRDIEIFQMVMRAMHEMGSDPESPEQFKNSLRISAPRFEALRPGEATRSVLDITKVETFLGWRPRVPLHLGLKSTVQGAFV